jgi:hypothetical protein
MSSGRREVVINTQERALSTDINRLQKFANADQAELLRHMIGVLSGGDMRPDIITAPDGTETPLSAEIVGGLMVRPATGSFGIAIDGGVMMALFPDAAADDSDYKYVRDEGLALGTLTFGANVSGSIRIDVVECRINPVPETVSDNRDVFNTTTGLFAATAVTKEVAARLEYRIRAGTGGAGYPAAVTEWLPLMVASIPNGAASNDDCTFWDVRPMLEDRVRTARVGTDDMLPEIIDVEGRQLRTSSTDIKLNGRWTAVHKGRGIGGVFAGGCPGMSATEFALDDAANQSGTVDEFLTGHVYVYACFPFGLPRWARYAEAPSARVPGSPKGLLVSSYVYATETGVPSAVVPLPASTGLVGDVEVEEAVCVWIASQGSLTSFASGHCTNKVAMFQPQSGQSITSAAYASSAYDFSITEDVWPPNAKAIYARMNTSVDVNAGVASGATTNELRVYEDAVPSGSNTKHILHDENVSNPTGAPGTFGLSTGTVRLPLPVKYPGSVTTPRTLRWSIAMSSGTMATNATLKVLGFEL